MGNTAIHLIPEGFGLIWGFRPKVTSIVKNPESGLVDSQPHNLLVDLQMNAIWCARTPALWTKWIIGQACKLITLA